MKPQNARILGTAILSTVLILACGTAAAQDGSWNVNANGNWGTAGSWLGNLIADGAGNTAWFTNDITATRTVTIDGPRTIGHIVLGDYTGGSAYTLTTNASGYMVFDNGAGLASLTLERGPAMTINSPFLLNSHLNVNIQTAVNITVNGEISGPNAGLVKDGPGRLILNRTNSYTGPTVIHNGFVRLLDSRFINQSSNMTINGGVLEIGSNNFVRAGGLGTASNQIQITGGVSGFSIFDTGADRSVTIGSAGSVVPWGSPYFNPSVFILTSTGATTGRILIFDNAIDLNGADREIDSVVGIGRVNRPITNGSATTAGLIKGGSGTLELTGTNRYDGATRVLNGSLRLYGPFTLSTNNTLVLDGGVVEFARTHAYQTPMLGTGAGKVQFAGAAGFGAHNGIREVNVNGTGEILKMGEGDLANWGALLLNGPNSGGRLYLLNGFDLNGLTRTVAVNSAYAAVLGTVTNTALTPAALEKTGSGTLLVTGDNYRHDGGTWIRAGTLQLGDYWARDGVLPGIQGNAGSLSNSGTLLVANRGDATISGNIEGAGALVQAGWGGTLTLAGTNLYNGNTVIRRGTLALDFSAPTAPGTNIIGTGNMSQLYLGDINYTGGALWMRGAGGAGVTNAQVFRGLTVNQGASAVRVDSGTDAAALLVVSNIVRNLGGTVDFTLPERGMILTTTLGANGILTGALTVGRADWATMTAPVDGTLRQITNYTGYTVFGEDVFNAYLLHDGTSNVRLLGDVVLAQPTVEVNTLSLSNNNTAVTISMGAGETLRVGTVGGVLLPEGGGTFTLGNVPGQGTLTAGSGDNGLGELVFINYADRPIVVNANIMSNGTGRLSMTKAGPGTLDVHGSVTLGLSNFFNAGAANFHGSTTIGVTRVNGGSLAFLGADNRLNGHLILQGGSATIGGPLNGAGYEIQMNQTHGGRSALYIDGDVLINRVRPSLNDNNFGVGAVFQTNGTVSTLTAGSGLTLAEGAGAYGYYRMLGGAVTGDVLFASRGIGVFDQFGGMVNPSNQFRFASNDGYALLNLYGGRMNAPGNASGITVAEHAYGGGTAVINVLGGALDTALNYTGKGFTLLGAAGNTAYLNLVSGSVTANQIQASQAIGNSVLNLNGGTLVAKAGTTLGGTFLQGLTAAYVYPGGAVVDVQAGAVTFNQGLVAPIRYGLASIPTNASMGGQYVGAPVVRIAGGSGTGAMAVAQMDFATGSITNFLVVNPGTGYLAADVLTVTLEGGGPLEQPSPFAVSGAALAANYSGGLTKLGTGTLVLNATNSYAGPTAVREGTLRLMDSQWLNASLNVVLDGGVLEIVSNNFGRASGLGSSAAQIQIPGGVSGFSVNGNGARTFTVGTAGSALTWGSPYFDPSIFVLQTTGANQNLTLDNAIDLNGADREISVAANMAVVNRPVTNGAAAAAGLVKSGTGILSLGSALNGYDGATTIRGGVLRITTPAALSTNNTVIMTGGLLEFTTAHPYLSPALGTGAGKVQFDGPAGFSVLNAVRTANVNGTGETLKMGDGSLTNWGALLLGGWNAGSGRIILANGLDLNGADRTVTVDAGFAQIDGPVTNTAAGSPALLEKLGNGTLLIAGDNYRNDGGMRIGAGTVELGDYWRRDGALPGLLGNAGPLTNHGTLNVANLADTVLSGGIAGSGALLKSGWGSTLTLAGANPYTGATTVRRGVLELDFSAPAAPAADIVGSGAMSALTLGSTGFQGGSLLLTGRDGVANAQTFRSLTVNAGQSAVIAVSGAAGSVNLMVSNLTRSAGGALDFTLPASGAIRTTLTNRFGILNGALTVGGTDWAAAAGATPFAVTNFTAYTLAGGPIADDNTQNLRLVGNASLAAATVGIHTLAVTNDGGDYTIDLAGKTLRLGTVGGVLVPAGAGSLTIGSSKNDGILTAGLTNNSAGELVFINHSTQPIVVNAAVSSNGSQRIQLTKAGAGPITFEGNVALGNNAFFLDGAATLKGTNVLGQTYVTGGRLNFAAGSSNRLTGTLLIQGGSVAIDAPVHSSAEVQMNTVDGGRSVLYINADLHTTRLRASATDNMLSGGAIFQTGGTLLGTSAGNGLTVSDGTGNYGYYGLAGGVVSGDVVVAYRGPAVFEQTGGAVTPSNQIQLVNNSGYAVYNLFGGSFQAPASPAGYINMAASAYGGATAVINVLGGSLDASFGGTNKPLEMMAQPGNTSYLNLDAGVVTANQIRALSPIGNAVLNLDGGTLVAAADSTASRAFVSGLSAAYVYDGGTTIDTPGTNAPAIVLTGLQAPSGHGLAAIATNANCGGGYIGAPAVQIAGGSGTGAMAVAQVDFATGFITNFLVVNPGTGYQAADTLTVTLSGGGPLTAPTNFTISGASLAANAGGGLTKTGDGILVLGGTNTFTGPIGVQGGMLDLAYAAPYMTNLTLAANAGMAFGVGGPHTLSEPVISNLLATRFGAGNSFGLDTSAGTYTWGTPVGGIRDFYKFGDHTLIVPTTNTYTGATYVMGGALRAEPGAGLPGTSHLVLNGGAWETAGGLATNWGAGAGQFEIPGGTSGFSAVSAPLAVNLGGAGAGLTWGQPLFSPEALVLNAPTADKNVLFVNNIDLAGNRATFVVGAETACLAGGLTNTLFASGQGALVKLGSGTLVLSNGVNGVLRLQGNPGLQVQQGTLELASGQIWSQNPANYSDYVGRYAGDNGTLILSGNSIFARSNAYLYVGTDAGSLGTFVIRDNAQFLGSYRLSLGNSAGSTGIVRQTGGLVRLGNDTYIGASGVGLYDLSGGLVTNFTTYIGVNNESRGILAQSGGAFRALGATVIGNNLGAAGAYYQTGGTYYGSNQLQIAAQSGSYGYFRMSGGTRTNINWVQIGYRGTGLYYQDGGTNWVTGSGMLLNNGQGENQAIGVVYVSGGVCTSGYNVVLGYNNNPAGGGRAEFTVDGAGRVMLNNSLQMNRNVAGSELMSTNILNLNGAGILRATQIFKGATGGMSVVNFDGGTLLAGASAANATFLQGLDAAFVRDGGATIDTYTNTVVIAQDLLAPAGRGVTALPWAGDLPGYIGAPYVRLSGGIGFGATAIALFDPAAGAVTGLVVTSAGSGYAPGDTVTATLSGGGAPDVVLGAATLGALGSGGLTKLGSGLLLLAGANTYTGLTTVGAGTLEAQYPSALPPAASLTASNGAAFAVGVGGAGQWSSAEVDALLASGAFLNGSSIGFDATLGDFAYGSAITGAVGLVKLGSNTLALSGANTYGGGTRILNGRIVLERDEGLGTGALEIGGPGTVGALSLSNVSQTVASMLVRSTPFLTNSIHIGAGQALTVAGYVTNGLRLQDSRTLTAMDGPGTFAVANPGGVFQVGSCSNATAVMDLRALGTFHADLGAGTFAVGPTDGSAGTSTNLLFLADRSTIVAGRLSVGDGVASTAGQSGLFLGSGVNELYTDLLLVAGGKQGAQLLFAGDTGTLTLSNRLGAGRANVAVGANRIGTGATATGLLDLRGHEAGLFIGSLTSGASIANSAGRFAGQVFFDRGWLDAESVFVGLRTSTGLGGVTGEVHIAGGTVRFGPTELARNSVAGSTTALGVLDLSGGLITMSGNIVKGGGAGPAVAMLLMTNSATLDMGGFAIGSAASPIDVLLLESGTLRNVGEINGGAAWAKTGAGRLTLEGVNTYTGPTLVSNGTLRVDGTHTGGGLITVFDGGSLAGTGTVGNVAVANGGALRPGGDTGTLAVGALTLDADARLEFNLGLANDLVLAGAVTLGGVDFPDFTFVPDAGFGPGEYPLIKATSVSGLGAQTEGTVGGYAAALRIDDENQDLVLTVIPEPGALAALGLLAVAALLRRRARRG